MATLFSERNQSYRIQWRFTVRAGPRAGENVAGSLSLGRCTRATAKTKLREIDAWQEAVQTGRHIPNQRFADIYALWLCERTLKCTLQTVERTERVIRMYLAWREERKLSSETMEQVAQREDLVAWRNCRLDGGEAGRKTVANDLSTLSALFAWCVLEKYLTDNPLDRVTKPRFIPHKEGTPLTRTQAARWLRWIRPRRGPGGSGPRNWTEARRKRHLASFLLNTGVRNGELCALSIEDLRIDEREQMMQVIGKGQKNRWVPLNRASLAAVRLHLRSRGNPKRGPLFVTASGKRYNERQLASEIVDTANGLDGGFAVNPHNLRHTFATWLVKSGCNVSVVQKILGHENVNTTLKYYVHTGDHEMAGATANLRGRREREAVSHPRPAGPLEIIPFPKKHAG